MADNVLVKLQVWRGRHENTSLMSVEDLQTVQPGDLLEEAYGCKIPDALYGALNQDDTNKLREALGRFAPDAPGPHNIAALTEVIGMLDQMVAPGEDAGWCDTGEGVEMLDGESVTRRLHGPLALRARLQWVCDTFTGSGSVKVTVR